MLYLAADHRGFQLKEEIRKFLEEKGIAYEDIGARELDLSDDYVDFARVASEKITENPEEHQGIFMCGSGHGMCITANKFRGIRAVLAFNKAVAVQSREHENANVLVFAADWIKLFDAKEIVEAWLGAQFTRGERHVRRLKKVEEIEHRTKIA